MLFLNVLFFEFCKFYSPDLIALVEPLVSFDFISLIFWTALDLRLVAVNKHGNATPVL